MSERVKDLWCRACEKWFTHTRRTPCPYCGSKETEHMDAANEPSRVGPPPEGAPPA